MVELSKLQQQQQNPFRPIFLYFEIIKTWTFLIKVYNSLRAKTESDDAKRFSSSKGIHYIVCVGGEGVWKRDGDILCQGNCLEFLLKTLEELPVMLTL